MTCVIGLRVAGEAWIASDGLVSDSQTRSVIASSKHERMGASLVGWSGTLGHAQFAMRVARGTSSAANRVEGLADALRSTVRREGIEEFGAELLIVRADGIFEVDSSFGVTHHADHFAAIGSGAAYALGVLAATASASMDPFERLKLALEVAAKYDNATGGTFNLERL